MIFVSFVRNILLPIFSSSSAKSQKKIEKYALFFIDADVLIWYYFYIGRLIFIWRNRR